MECQYTDKLDEENESEITQLCPAVCDSLDYTARGILQGRILESVAVPFSRRSSQSRDQTPVSLTAGNSLPAEPQTEAPREGQWFTKFLLPAAQHQGNIMTK